MKALGPLSALIYSSSAPALGKAKPSEPGWLYMAERISKAFQVRVRAAGYERDVDPPKHSCNNDEELLGGSACYSKCLPHNSAGEVDTQAYEALLKAIRSGEHKDFEAVPTKGMIKLANPQAAYAFDLVGPDCQHVTVPQAPSFSSAEHAADMCEVYWHALLRDVPFSDYDSHPLALKAAEDLSRCSNFRGPKQDRKVTPGNIFRGGTAGDLKGPYISQFLLKQIPYGAMKITQKILTTAPGVDYMTQYDGWLAIQNGVPGGKNIIEQPPQFIRNGRDLGEYVHRDFTYQAFLDAFLILFGMQARLDSANPYLLGNSLFESGFVTFGPADFVHMVALVANPSLKAAWFQKWMVHRKIRPEEFGGRVHNHLTKAGTYPIHEDLLNSPVLPLVYERYKAYLLPMAYPEGCPTHTSYPAGHAVIAGACATVLKAIFDEDFIIPDPVIATRDGLAVEPYVGPNLTVGGELDKLADNIAIGRNFAGAHYRADGQEGILLGEEVAIRILREMKMTSNELFEGFTVRRFNGERIKI